MARNQGRHRIARRTKIATGALGLAIATGALVVTTTTGDTGQATADEADPSLYVDITTVQPNVVEPTPSEEASTGTFTVDCGRNEEEHFNADNFIAQPGVRHGAEHLHDYVGNLSTNADSTNESLLAADTTCANGDKSTYYWPVLRVNSEEETGAGGPSMEVLNAQRAQAKRLSRMPRVQCPDVVTKLPNVPDRAMSEINRQLRALDDQVARADQQVRNGKYGAMRSLREQRRATIARIVQSMSRFGNAPRGLDRLPPCQVDDENGNGIDNGSENSEGDGGEQSPPHNHNNELPGNEGQIQQPVSVDLTFRGSSAGPVNAMPRFLRVLTGQAKPTENGDELARPAFTCSGFEDRIVDKYVVCPEGSQVMRVHDFPSCWDGQNIDSANHRDHIVFPDEQSGACPEGFEAVPQLRITLTYDIPQEVQQTGQYTIDSFPEEANNPLSDHDDFANVMSQDIMNRVVNCINDGDVCNE